MKSTWMVLAFTRRRDASPTDRELEALTERDVAGGVLVEQRVVEDRAELADSALAVDERNLAEAGLPRRPDG